MKFRIRMEDFIADEDDKELAKVAFHRAERAVHRRTLLVMIPLGMISFILLLLDATLGALMFGIPFLIICFVMVFRYYDLVRKEYHVQLDELKLEKGRK